MVHTEGVLEALGGQLAVGPRPAGVVDEDVEALPTGEDVLRRLLDRRQVGQVQGHDMDVVVPGALRDLLGGDLGLRRVAAGQHRGGTERGHAHRRLEPDADVGAGDEDDLAVHAHGEGQPTRGRQRPAHDGPGAAPFLVGSRANESGTRHRRAPAACALGGRSGGGAVAGRCGQRRPMSIASSPNLDGWLLQVLVTPEGQADPYPWYARMREEARVSRTAFGPYCVNGYEECLAVL